MALIIWGSSGVISCIRLAWEVFRNLPSTKVFRVGKCLRAGALHDIKSTWWRLMKWSMKAHNPQWRNVIPNEDLELCSSSNGFAFCKSFKSQLHSQELATEGSIHTWSTPKRHGLKMIMFQEMCISQQHSITLQTCWKVLLLLICCSMSWKSSHHQLASSRIFTFEQ